MKRTLGTNMLIRIWGSTMVLFLGVFLAGSFYSKKEVIRGVEDESKNLAQYYMEKYEGRFGQAEKIAGMTALNAALHPFRDEAELKRYMKGVMEANPDIYGTCVAYDPNAFADGRGLFAPYYYSRAGELVFVQLGNEQYDYLARDWYQIPKHAGRPAWTDPYFDTGGGETLMITYSAPIIRDERFIGVATVDISLDELVAEVDKIKVLQSGYAFILSRKGHFISCPDSSLIMRAGLGELDPELAARMTSAESGFVDRPDPFRRKRSWIVYYPIPSAKLSLAIVYPFQEVMARVFAFERTALRLGLISLFALMLIVALVSRSIARPVVNLASAVRKVAAGALDFQLPPTPSSDEVGELTVAFNKMVQDLRYHMEELKKSVAEKERIASELDVANRIQQSILPSNFQDFSAAPGFDIFARSVPAREVGGDFYDFFALDDKRIGFVIGDVSGKGVPAALFMAVCRTLLKATAQRGVSPGDCLSQVNALLLPENEMLMFVTVFYGALDVSTGEVVYANAGHNPPCRLRCDGSLAMLSDEPQLALGISDGARYATRTLRLDPGDAILLYTDGITEAVNASAELFDNPRMERALLGAERSTAKAIIADLFDAVREFTGQAEQTDDITALALRYTGPSRRQAHWRFANQTAEVRRLRELMGAFAAESGLPERTATAVMLALEEILVNIIQYAFAEDAERVIDVRLEADGPDELRIVVADDGRPFNPLAIEPPNTNAPLDERQIGGLGIHLVRKLMDEVRYRYADGKNLLTMIKRAET